MEACLFDRFVLFGEQRIFYPTIHLISESRVNLLTLVRVTPWKFVDSADSFYSANIILFGKYYARSDIVLSIRKLHLMNDNDPYKFVDSADSFDSANGYF